MIIRYSKIKTKNIFCLCVSAGIEKTSFLCNSLNLFAKNDGLCTICALKILLKIAKLFLFYENYLLFFFTYFFLLITWKCKKYISFLFSLAFMYSNLFEKEKTAVLKTRKKRKFRLITIKIFFEELYHYLNSKLS